MSYTRLYNENRSLPLGFACEEEDCPERGHHICAVKLTKWLQKDLAYLLETDEEFAEALTLLYNEYSSEEDEEENGD